MESASDADPETIDFVRKLLRRNPRMRKRHKTRAGLRLAMNPKHWKIRQDIITTPNEHTFVLCYLLEPYIDDKSHSGA
jgi:hypothetical protein